MSAGLAEDSPMFPDERPALRFPHRVYAWDFQQRAVRFWARAGNQGILCRVTLAALQDHFQLIGAGGPLAKEAFASGRLRIESLATQKWDAWALEPDGSILLRSDEF